MMGPIDQVTEKYMMNFDDARTAIGPSAKNKPVKMKLYRMLRQVENLLGEGGEGEVDMRKVSLGEKRDSHNSGKRESSKKHCKVWAKNPILMIILFPLPLLFSPETFLDTWC